MRDLFFAAIMGVLLLRALSRAEVGAYVWAWLSLMNPHKMTYGFAYSLPWAQMCALATLTSILFSKTRRALPMNGGVVIILLLWFWMSVTSVFSINPSDMVFERWLFITKILLMLLATLLVVRDRNQINILVAVVAGSIAFFSFKGGLFTIATGGSYRVWGPSDSMVEENNALAVATMIALPFVFYLRQLCKKAWQRVSLLFVMLVSGASVLGSQSRGAFLALVAMVVVLAFKSKRPLLYNLILGVALATGVAFMPDSWVERMDTIQNYSGDSSAMSRIYTWHTLWNVAVDRPLVGSGFRADRVEIFDQYAPKDAQYANFIGLAWVAHSIYLQALGEHGFVGLFLFLALWAWTWIAAGRLARQAERVPEFSEWMPVLLRMCQVATLAFCVGGAFLSLMLFDMPYYIVGFVTLCQCLFRETQQAAAASAGAGPGDSAVTAKRVNS